MRSSSTRLPARRPAAAAASNASAPSRTAAELVRRQVACARGSSDSVSAV